MNIIKKTKANQYGLFRYMSKEFKVSSMRIGDRLGIQFIYDDYVIFGVGTQIKTIHIWLRSYIFNDYLKNINRVLR